MDNSSDEKGFDWTTMRGFIESYATAPINGNINSSHNQVVAKLDEIKGAIFPVNFHFKWKGRTNTVHLVFKTEMTAPRRDEPILLSFIDHDDGKAYRVSSFADYSIHHYVDADTVQSVPLDGLILNIWLKPVTVQPTEDEIHKEYDLKYGELPAFETFEAEQLYSAIKKVNDG